MAIANRRVGRQRGAARPDQRNECEGLNAGVGRPFAQHKKAKAPQAGLLYHPAFTGVCESPKRSPCLLLHAAALERGKASQHQAHEAQAEQAHGRNNQWLVSILHASYRRRSRQYDRTIGAGGAWARQR